LIAVLGVAVVVLLVGVAILWDRMADARQDVEQLKRRLIALNERVVALEPHSRGSP
jgi:hypothetical protein